MSSSLNSLIQNAIDRFQKGDLTNAKTCLDEALQLAPSDFDAHHIMGVLLVHQGQHRKAQDFFKRAIAVNPESSIAHFNLATSLSEIGDNEGALTHHERTVEIAPHNPDAWVNYGRSLSELKRFHEALNCFEKALRINSELPQALGNQGAIYAELHRNEEALACFDKVLTINPSIPAAWSNKANALCRLRRHDEALAIYDRAIQLDPHNADTWARKGDALCSLKRHKEALTQFDHAIQLNPKHADAWHYKGNALNELKRPQEALTHYDQAIRLKPDHDYLHGDRLTTQMAICDWSDIQTQFNEIANRLKNDQPAATPFDVLGMLDSPASQRKAADLYAQHFPVNHSLGEIPVRVAKDKIRIGYFSKDFQNHATAFLTAELYELHDRNKFEVIALSFGPPSNDHMRTRLLLAFDQFIDVRNKTNSEIAQLARELELDIAVDVQGYQTEHRTGIFAHRAAPIQVNYLAYPGTMGAPYMDYLIADQTLIPTESRQYYSEKIIYLPDSYQVNDRQRGISDKTFTREELGLPQTGFVFCCFNNNYKILPATFDSWMRILNQVEGSVLWLLEGNHLAAQNLRHEAIRRGVAADRLIFAKQMDLPEHLARHRAADLFLDTLPYNAHTTASDALWAGLPVLTCQGESFTSRVAASLLNAIQLPELITRTQADFEQFAIDFATQPAKQDALRQKLANNLLTAPLFDTPRYVTHLEAAYTEMVRRYQADLLPDHIEVN